MHAITLASEEIKPVDPVVFYDPNKPGRSCLVVGIDETTLALAIIASVVGLSWIEWQPPKLQVAEVTDGVSGIP
jgi:hypothetical protein